MVHKEFRRLVDGAGTAVLFIHGIIGTPNHFHDFVRQLPAHVSVINLLLDGHGKGVKEFSNTSLAKWRAQVQAVVEELTRTHEQVFIVGHSMGTLLAIEQAIANRKVTRLFLMAVPLRLFVRPAMFLTSMKVYSGRVRPNDAVASAAVHCCGIEHCRNPLRYVGWIPRYFDLFSLIRHTRKLLPSLSTACCAVQSGRDEMVSARAAEELRRCDGIRLTVLPNSGHYYYPDDDKDCLMRAFRDFIINE